MVTVLLIRNVCCSDSDSDRLGRLMLFFYQGLTTRLASVSIATLLQTSDKGKLSFVLTGVERSSKREISAADILSQ